MPKDSKGNFHLNNQRAMAADKMPGKPRALGASMKKPGLGAPMPDASSDGLSPDGTAPGGDAAQHLTDMHAQMGGRHMHVHEGEDGSLKTHQIGHDGAVQGPHQHADAEALKHHVGKFLNDQQEGHGGMTGDGEQDGY